jgi:glutathione S-transferase
MPAYRLHYFPESGNSYKLALMLTLCGQSFEPVWTDFFGGVTLTPEWRAAHNAMGEVPVLQDGPETLTQTAAILLRLADRHGLFGPRDDTQRFEFLRWLMWDNHKLTSYTATYRYYRTFDPSLDPAVLAFQRGRMLAALDILNIHLRDRGYVVGDSPSIVDLSMCGYLFFPSEETGIDLAQAYPAIATWLGHLSALPGWRGPYDLLPGPRHSLPRP